MAALIGVLPGDGIGTEVVDQALRVIDAIVRRGGHAFELRRGLIGGAAIDATGKAFPEATRQLALQADAVLLGAVGGPKWSDPAARERPEQGLLDLRAAMGVYANVRPVRTHPSLYEASPLKADRLRGVDILVIRELTGGIYFGTKQRDADSASDLCSYTRAEIERVLRVAATMARRRRGRVTSVDKANVLETSRLWRSVANELFAREFPELQLEHLLVDAAAMHLLLRPADFDIMVTENMFGDIITDLGAITQGGLGVAAGGNINPQGVSMFEPIGGTAPMWTGKNAINPLAAILAGSMMLETLGERKAADRIEKGVMKVIETDMKSMEAGKMGISTTEVGDRVAGYVS